MTAQPDGEGRERARALRLRGHLPEGTVAQYAPPRTLVTWLEYLAFAGDRVDEQHGRYPQGTATKVIGHIAWLLDVLAAVELVENRLAPFAGHYRLHGCTRGCEDCQALDDLLQELKPP